jgi:hypothetical protein
MAGVVYLHIDQETAMGWMDVLNQYRNSPGMPPNVAGDFEAIAHEVPRHDLSDGIEEAFRSEQTPPFESMVRQLFEHSDPDQRSGVLNRLREALGRGPITPDEAREVPPAEVEATAAQAARNNPGILQRVAQFYAEHPQVVQMLGQAALGVAMNRMAMRRRA